MNITEIRSWFDKAHDHLYQADFARAATCFQQVIDHSGDIYAANVARRDLNRLCLPLEYIVGRLIASPDPLSLNKLLEHGNYPNDLGLYLQKIQSICQLDDEFWVSEEVLRREVKEKLRILLS